MICAVDSSVLVAALRTSEPHHARCAAVLDEGGLLAHVHTLAETFSALTGGRILPRVSPSQAAQLIGSGIIPFISTSGLSAREYLAAMGEAEARGVRGGAIHDFLHLFAAKRRKAARLYTLDVLDFKSFHRPGDPEIVHP
jgi:predicted nucleic acid-binding protein